MARRQDGSHEHEIGHHDYEHEDIVHKGRDGTTSAEA